MKMRATKAMSYQTRRLQPGDEFEASDRWARIFRGTRQAIPADQAPPPAPPADEQSPPPSEERMAELVDEAGYAEEDEGNEDRLTASDVRRMKKADLATLIQEAGEDVDEEQETREDLLNRALALLRMR